MRSANSSTEPGERDLGACPQASSAGPSRWAALIKGWGVGEERHPHPAPLAGGVHKDSHTTNTNRAEVSPVMKINKSVWLPTLVTYLS